MKKSIRKYLEERRNMARHNLYCYSANYAMTKPIAGMEDQFSEAVRECEIVDELLELIKEYPTSDGTDVYCEESLETLETVDNHNPYKPWSKDILARPICEYQR